MKIVICCVNDEAGTVVLSCVVETNVVANGLPTRYAFAAVEKLLPLRVMILVAEPASIRLGVTELTCAAGYSNVTTAESLCVGSAWLRAVMLTLLDTTAFGAV